MKISVCIPMYNEEAIAADCARTLHDAMTAHSVMTGDSFEIIFCDDGSTDRCADCVREAAAQLSDITVVGYTDNRGKGSAVREAIAASTGDIVIYTDCDPGLRHRCYRQSGRSAQGERSRCAHRLA